MSWSRVGATASLVMSLIAVPGVAHADTPQASTQPLTKRADHARSNPHKILVRFDQTLTDNAQSAMTAVVGGNIARRSTSVPGLVEVDLPAANASAAIELLTSFHGVLYAEPDYIVKLRALPDDTFFQNLWGLHNTGQTGGTVDADIDAPEAWDQMTDSSSVVIGIIDSGVDYTHPDLLLNLRKGETNCSDGIDNDGNGKTDDCYGWNAIANNGNPMDDNGHGTHVAGTIGARGNNARGVTGISWQAQISSCKFSNSTGNGALSDAVECFDYFAALYDQGVPIVVTNNSWGGYSHSQAVEDAILAHQNRGIVTVVAAGNDENDNDSVTSYPDGLDHPSIIAVAASDHTDAPPWWTNFGLHSVDIAAPGASIGSTLPGDSYAAWSGTSMASPHVAGAIAFLAAQFPALTGGGLVTRTFLGGDPLVGFGALTSTGMRLNLNGALTCSGLQQKWLSPRDFISAGVGESVDLRFLSFNCTTNSPSANAIVEVSGPGSPADVTLVDNGLSGDQVAGDGILRGSFVPPQEGTYTLTFPDGSVTQVGSLPVPHQPDASVAKASTGPFRGLDVINATGAGQTTGKNGRKGVNKTFYMAIENEGPSDESFLVDELSIGNGLRATYFFGGSNVTSLVQTGMPIDISGGGSKSIRVVLRFTKVLANTAKRFVTVEASSASDDSLNDVVKMQLLYRRPKR